MEKLRLELTKFIDGIYEGEKKVLVHGEGRIGARLMLIGEAPGEQETLQYCCERWLQYGQSR